MEVAHNFFYFENQKDDDASVGTFEDCDSNQELLWNGINILSRVGMLLWLKAEKGLPKQIL